MKRAGVAEEAGLLRAGEADRGAGAPDRGTGTACRGASSAGEAAVGAVLEGDAEAESEEAWPEGVKGLRETGDEAGPVEGGPARPGAMPPLLSQVRRTGKGDGEGRSIPDGPAPGEARDDVLRGPLRPLHGLRGIRAGA